MRKAVLALPVCIAFGLSSTALAEDQPEFKVIKVEIVPNSEADLKQDAFFRGRPLIEVAPTPEKGNERFRLPTYRSYRFIVTIRLSGKGKVPSSFLVKTECVRDGKTVTLGKTRSGLENRLVGYACYDVFPAEGGAGDCLIRTFVEADNGKNALEFKATIGN
jgi:hypothetical protein